MSLEIDAPPKEAPKPSTRTLAIKGSIWSIGGFGGAQVLRLLSNIIMARLLTQSDFGIMVYVNFVLATVVMFSNFGLAQSIVQHKRGNDPDFLNTAWTILSLRGVLMWLACMVMAWPVAGAVGMSPWYIVAAGASCLISSLKSTSYELQKRHLSLHSITLLDLSNQVITVILTIAIAWHTRSVWAFICATLISSTLSTIFSHTLLEGPRNRFHWDRAAARSMMAFGKWMFFSVILMFLAGQFDKVLLAVLVPLSVAGLYGQASSLSQLPLQISSRLGSYVLYPILAKESREERGRVGARLIQARRLMLGASLLVTLAIVFYSPFFFRLYRPEWAPAAWMAQVMCFSVWFLFLQTSCSQALLAVGDSRSLAFSNFVKLVATGVCGVGGFLIGGLTTDAVSRAALWHLLQHPDVLQTSQGAFTALLTVTNLLTAQDHFVGKMVGFLVGLTLAGLAGHIVIQVALVGHRMNIFWQDLRYTGALLGFSLVGVCLPVLVRA